MWHLVANGLPLDFKIASDNETIDEFFNDVSNIIEKRTGGIINKNPEKYTLFDDADYE